MAGPALGCDDHLVTDQEFVFDQVKLWRADSIVLFDWLMTVELDRLPMTNRAQRHGVGQLP